MTTRRTFTHWSVATLALLTAFGAKAQTYPDRPIKIIVGFPAGQAADLIGRLVAQKLSDVLKQAVIIDNRPGAAAIIAHEAVKAAAPDGYTLLIGSNGSLAVNPTLFRQLPYDPLNDFEPISTLAGAPFVLFTSAATPVNNLKEMLAYVKARPGQASYGSPGSGTGGHISMEMLKKAADLDIVHVPYKGSPPMITDVIGGQVDFAFESAAAIMPFAKGGRVKLLAVTSPQRSPFAPDVATVAEQGFPGYAAVGWTGLLAPKGTPAAIVQTLNTAVNKVLKDPTLIAGLANISATPMGGSSADFHRFMQSEIARWGKAVKDSGAHVG